MPDQPPQFWDILGQQKAGSQSPIRPSAAPSAAPAPGTGSQHRLKFDPVYAAGPAKGAPPAPETPEQTGLPQLFLEEMLLKCIYFEGRTRSIELAQRLYLPYHAIETPLDHLKDEAFVAVVGGGASFGKQSMEYALTEKGRAKAQEVLNRDNYYGPCPVPIEVFLKRIELQSITAFAIPPARVDKAFSRLVLDAHVPERIGPAINSGRSIFLYGPPGNGKTALAQCITESIGGDVWMPRALYVDKQIIKLYDALYHEEIPGADKDFPRHDERWVHCKRPIVMVGGELTLETLDLVVPEAATYYEAPFQLKATNGVLFIDDFGRQKCDPQELLNRWIVPLESRFDFLTFQSGMKVRFPFDCLLVFSTNLDPKDLVDDAFLRRIRYKIAISDPSETNYRKIFDIMSKVKGITVPPGIVDYLINTHYKGKRPFRACQPRDLLEQFIDLAKYSNTPTVLTPEIVDRLCALYFADL